MKYRQVVAWSIGGALLLLSLGDQATAQDSLGAIKTLYASAAYEDALSAIDRLRSAGPSATDARGIDQYRAFCLLALGRDIEATRALEDLVSSDPFFVPDSNEVAPRVLTLFHGIRARLLPGIVQQKYSMAKATYDRKEFVAAVDQFTRVLSLMSDADMDQKTPGLGDMKTLASGFLDLAKGAAAPPKPPEPVTPPTPPPAPPPVRTVFDGSDPDVAPPTAQRQDIPPYPISSQSPMFINTPLRPGVLEIVIDEAGRVERATMRQSITANYDSMLLSAAASWRYNPALRNGKPVKYRKLIQVNVDPRK